MARWTAEDIERAKQRIGRIIANPLIVTYAKPRKYHNDPLRVDGHYFDSKLEARRYSELQLLVTAGLITDLRVHPKYDLHVNNIKLGYYEADFDYLEGNQRVVEDCKGVETAIYRWKRLHMLAEHNIEIREIKA